MYNTFLERTFFNIEFFAKFVLFQTSFSNAIDRIMFSLYVTEKCVQFADLHGRILEKVFDVEVNVFENETNHLFFLKKLSRLERLGFLKRYL